MKNKKIIIIVIVIILIIAAGSGWYWYKNRQDTTENDVATVKLQRGAISASINATGSLSAVVSVDVGSSVNGQLVDVYVNENDYVKKGQLVAKVDDAKIKNQLQQARLKADNAMEILQRQERLFANGAVAKQDYDKVRLDYDLAIKDIEVTEKQIADTNIMAPISGIIIGQPMPAGQTIGGANLQTIMTIADLTAMEVNALIDESDVGNLQVGQRATFTIDTFSQKTFQGTVELISYKVKTQQNVNYYNAVINVDRTAVVLRPGMTAHINIITAKRDNALLVPLKAIREQNGKQYVEVKTEKGTEKREIVIGISDDESAEVLSGLDENDEVVLPGIKKNGTRSANKSPHII